MMFFPDTDYSAATAFGGNTLDRMSERREDGPFIAAMRGSASARIVLFADDLIVVGDGDIVMHDRAVAEALGVNWDEAVFLGVDRAGPIFAAAAREPAPDAPFSLDNLRAFAIREVVSVEVLGVLAEGRSLVHWHARHGFCANCGASTRAAQAGFRRDCGSCGASHFPRTDPVVIMLAVDGERCLLGRQRRFEEGRYSCLAGFMEPGETIEAAVRREIWEEAGVRTRRVAYHSSQPWPFPASLMIGCIAQAVTTDIEPRDSELEDVRWFTRDEIKAMLAGDHDYYSAPPPIAIAYHLLSAYAHHGAPVLSSGEPVSA